MAVYYNSKKKGGIQTVMVKDVKVECCFGEVGDQMECVQCGRKIDKKSFDDKGVYYCEVEKLYPSDIMSRAARFFSSYRKWVNNGRPLRNIKRIQKIYDDNCSPCEFFYNDQCTVCGCRIKRDTLFMNKLAWASERCPLASPQWIEEEAPANRPKAKNVSVPRTVRMDELKQERRSPVSKEEKAEKPPKPPRRCCN